MYDKKLLHSRPEGQFSDADGLKTAWNRLLKGRFCKKNGLWKRIFKLQIKVSLGIMFGKIIEHNTLKKDKF